MALILAIEPDRRQAAQLSALMRTRVGAELVLADTTERALDAIGARVPELVLVPALISPQDDAALAAALRVIAAATDVQVLTTPLFAVGRPESATGGPLSSLWRRRKALRSPEGCAPEVFAEQVVSYLKRVTADREQAARLDAATMDVREDVCEADVAQPSADAELAPPLATAQPEAPPEVPAVAGLTLETMLAELAVTFVRPEEPVVQEITACEWIGEDSVFPAEIENLYPGDVLTLTAEATFDVAPEMEREVEICGPEETGDPDEPCEIDESIEAASWTAATLPSTPRSLLEGVVVENSAHQAAPAPLDLPTPVVADQGTPDRKAQDRPEWVELIVSLRADIERLRAERAAPPVSIVRAAPPEAHLVPFPSPGERTAPHRHKPRQKPRPIQDEWGFFDPEQCGFAALLAKLEEITEEREEASGDR